MPLPDLDISVSTKMTYFIRAVNWNVWFRNKHQGVLLPFVNWVSGVLSRSPVRVGFMRVVRGPVCGPRGEVPGLALLRALLL